MIEKTNQVLGGSPKKSSRWKPRWVDPFSGKPFLVRSSLRTTVFIVLLIALGIACAPALPTQARVRDIIDGDTIRLMDGRLVRYLGINAPEVRRRIGDRWVEDPEPFGLEATEANRRLVEGRTIRLAYDVQTHDRYGRLLAYVYVEDTMVNEMLVREGFAQPMTIPPNVKYAQQFHALAQDARRHHRGLWGHEDLSRHEGEKE